MTRQLAFSLELFLVVAAGIRSLKCPVDPSGNSCTDGALHPNADAVVHDVFDATNASLLEEADESAQPSSKAKQVADAYNKGNNVVSTAQKIWTHFLHHDSHLISKFSLFKTTTNALLGTVTEAAASHTHVLLARWFHAAEFTMSAEQAVWNFNKKFDLEVGPDGFVSKSNILQQPGWERTSARIYYRLLGTLQQYLDAHIERQKAIANQERLDAEGTENVFLTAGGRRLYHLRKFANVVQKFIVLSMALMEGVVDDAKTGPECSNSRWPREGHVVPLAVGSRTYKGPKDFCTDVFQSIANVYGKKYKDAMEHWQGLDGEIDDFTDITAEFEAFTDKGSSSPGAWTYRYHNNALTVEDMVDMLPATVSPWYYHEGHRNCANTA